MSQEQNQQNTINNVALNLATFMTNKVTISLFSCLSIIILTIIFVSYKLSSNGNKIKDFNHGSVFSNKPYDF